MDAKWYANWIRLLPASSVDEKMRNLEAADLLEQLEAQAPRWISVEERMPEDYDTVIIFREDCRVATIGWLIRDVWSVPKGVRVTHWMPLPQAPKEDAT